MLPTFISQTHTHTQKCAHVSQTHAECESKLWSRRQSEAQAAVLCLFECKELYDQILLFSARLQVQINSCSLSW